VTRKDSAGVRIVRYEEPNCGGMADLKNPHRINYRLKAYVYYMVKAIARD
jgi:hypothetical protein